MSAFHLFNGMINLRVNHFFVQYLGESHGFGESPANTTAAAHVNKAILRAGIERIFALHVFGVEHHIPLLSGMTDKIGQAFPGHKVVGAGSATGRRSSGSIIGAALAF